MRFTRFALEYIVLAKVTLIPDDVLCVLTRVALTRKRLRIEQVFSGTSTDAPNLPPASMLTLVFSCGRQRV